MLNDSSDDMPDRFLGGRGSFMLINHLASSTTPLDDNKVVQECEIIKCGLVKEKKMLVG